MSGHSKWATTKRHKAVIDAKKSSIFTKLARNITLAAKTGKNLDIAIDSAKKASMPKDNIQRAIDRGTGKLAGDAIETINYEVYGPNATGVIVKVVTDNKNRALSEIKAVLNRNNGRLANSGAVSYLFEEQGVIELNQADQTLSGDDLEMVIIDAGAKDYSIEEGIIYVYTDPKQLSKVKEALEFKSLKVDNAKIEFSPKNYIEVPAENRDSVVNLLQSLEDLDDVDEVYTNANI